MVFAFYNLREPARLLFEKQVRLYFSDYLLKFNPSMFSWLNLGFSIIAGISIYYHNLLATVVFYTFAIVSDGLDGIIARNANKNTNYGNFLDSSIDRIGEAIFFLGLFMSGIYPGSIIFVIAITSLITPFLHTQLILHGVKYQPSIFEKGDRVILMLCLLILSLIFNIHLSELLFILAILNTISVIQLFFRGNTIKHKLSVPTDPDPTTIDDDYYQGRESYAT